MGMVAAVMMRTAGALQRSMCAALAAGRRPSMVLGVTVQVMIAAMVETGRRERVRIPTELAHVLTAVADRGGMMPIAIGEVRTRPQHVEGLLKSRWILEGVDVGQPMASGVIGVVMRAVNGRGRTR